MFGILYAVIIGIATLFSGTKSALENHVQIEKAKRLRAEGKNKHNVYTDRKGATRDLETGELRSIDYIGCESDGEDQYMRDMYGNPVKNLSMERRMDRRSEAVADPRRTVFLWSNGVNDLLAGENGRPCYSGKQYKDISNGKLYVCRWLSFPKEISPNHGGGRFYMDTSNGMLVREVDGQIFDRANGNYEYSEEINKQFIEYFNRLQAEGGYVPIARIRRTSGWDQTESEFDRNSRLTHFYCNNKACSDEPMGGRI